MQRLSTILLTVLVLGSGRAVAQPDVAAWTRLVGSNNIDYGYAAAADPAGHGILAGATQGILAGGNAGRYDLFVARYDPAGSRLWLVRRGTAERDFAYGTAADAAGNIYVTGYTGAALDGQTHLGDWDIFLSRFGPGGNWIWTRQVGTGQKDEGRAVATDPSGNILMTGYARGDFHGIPRVGSADVVISKYNTAGTRLWSALFGSTEVDESFGIACDGSGNVFVTGWCSGSIDGTPYLGNGDNFLARYSPSGAQLWVRQWGTVNKDTGYAVAADAAGNVYVCGYTTGSLYGPPLGERDAFLARYDAAGNLLWGRQFGTAGHDQAWGLATDAGGNAWVTGQTGGPLDGNPHFGGLDVFLARYDPQGNRLWTVQYGTEADDWAQGAAAGPDSTVFLGGTTAGSLAGEPNQGLEDAFIMKFVPGPPAPPTDAVATPPAVCPGSPSVLSATPGAGGDTVEWFTDGCGVTLVPGGASPTVSPLVTTTYHARTRKTAGGAVSTTCATLTLTVHELVGPDLDRDCDVDRFDFNLLAACLAEPGTAPAEGCGSADFDGDNDVDQLDFGLLQRCYSGVGQLPEPQCDL